jgi:hypothetical protein
MTSTKKSRSNVLILTHDGYHHVTQTTSNMLATFFTDPNNIRTGVKTFIVDNAIVTHKEMPVFSMIHDSNYSKNICSVKYLLTVSHSLDIPAPVMFIFCHGSRGQSSDETSYLNFSDEDSKNVIFSKRIDKNPDDLCLHDVIFKSNLVFLACCAGNQIVQEYLSEQNKDAPDIVYFNCDCVRQLTTMIFVVWLIKIMDSTLMLKQDPTPEQSYKGIRHSLRSIIYVIHQCENDHDMFWDHLLEWGVISKYTQVKEKENQDVPRARFSYDPDFDHTYQIYGFARNLWIKDKEIEPIFNDFQALTLVSSTDQKTPVFETYTSDFTVQSPEQFHVKKIHMLLSQLKSISIMKSSI